MNRALRSLRIRIPGPWCDGWLYKENLVLWSYSGTLHFVPLREIRSRLLPKSDALTQVAADFLIFRNDWKISEQFQEVSRIPEATSALFNFDGGNRFVELTDVPVEASATIAHDGYLLDIEVYANRLYAATESGLFETAFDPRFPEANNPLHQVDDKVATSVAAKAGKVAASFGDSGLKTRDVTFGSGPEWWRDAQAANLQTIDDLSVAVDFAHYSLLNYRPGAEPSFIRAHTSQIPATGQERYDRTVIDKYDRALTFESELAEAISAKGYVDVHGSHATSKPQERPQGDVRVLGNSNFHLLTLSQSGPAVVNVSAYKDEPVKVRRNRQFSSTKVNVEQLQRTLSTQPLSSGFLLESFDGVGLVTKRGSYSLIDEPRVRVRTFPRARRHQDCFIAIGDNYIELVGFAEVEAPEEDPKF